MTRECALILALALLLPATRAVPTLYRVVTPVSAGETLLIAGFDLHNVTTVRFCDGTPTCADVPLSLPASLTVRATVPALSPLSTLTAELLPPGAGGAPLAVATLNTPQVDWWQGARATPSSGGAGALFGHHLRLLGRSLAWHEGLCLPFTRQAGAQPAVRVLAVEAATGAVVPFQVTFASCYRVDVVVPAAGLTPDAVYALHLDNGLAGPGIGANGTTAVVPSMTFSADDWPTALFYLNVTGAAAPTANCNSVPQCLATAAAAGGGTVLAPAGVFTVCENWRFPDRTALVGAGRGRTTFWWHAWCGTAVTFDPATDPNSSGGVPIITGEPGARWRLSDMNLYGQAWGGHGYQPPLGTDFVGLGLERDPVNAGAGGFGGSAAQIARVNISFDLRMSPQAQLGNAFAVYGAADFSLTDSFVGHWGSCSSQWPHNTIMHITNSSNGEIRGNRFDMGCQAYAVESSSRIFIADNAFEEVPVWGGAAGIGSSNGGAEWSTIDPPHVSELQYMGNCTYLGRYDAFERWESFTTDGGADAFYNDTALSQSENPDGTATVVLASEVFESVFFYTWHRGNVVTVMQGPSVGQVRRLLAVAEDNVTITVDAPFDPPLGPDDILSITSYRGRYTVEGNSFFNGTCFQFYGGVFDAVISGNTFDEMFAANWEETMGWSPGARAPLPGSAYGSGGVGAGIGGGGRVYATSYQNELYNLWEHNTMRCANAFKITMGNLENGEAISRPNATFNMAQVVRRNSFQGLTGVQLFFTRDHVLELNELLPTHCAYNGADMPATPVNTSWANVGLLYRP